MSQTPYRMDYFEAAMEFELVASKKLRFKCEKLAQQVHELQLQCEKLRSFFCGIDSQAPGTTIKITPEMFKPE
jgi:hypothetical protein